MANEGRRCRPAPRGTGSGPCTSTGSAVLAGALPLVLALFFLYRHQRLGIAGGRFGGIFPQFSGFPPVWAKFPLVWAKFPLVWAKFPLVKPHFPLLNDTRRAPESRKAATFCNKWRYKTRAHARVFCSPPRVTFRGGLRAMPSSSASTYLGAIRRALAGGHDSSLERNSP